MSTENTTTMMAKNYESFKIISKDYEIILQRRADGKTESINMEKLINDWTDFDYTKFNLLIPDGFDFDHYSTDPRTYRFDFLDKPSPDFELMIENFSNHFKENKEMMELEKPEAMLEMISDKEIEKFLFDTCADSIHCIIDFFNDYSTSNEGEPAENSDEWGSWSGEILQGISECLIKFSTPHSGITFLMMLGRICRALGMKPEEADYKFLQSLDWDYIRALDISKTMIGKKDGNDFNDFFFSIAGWNGEQHLDFISIDHPEFKLDLDNFAQAMMDENKEHLELYSKGISSALLDEMMDKSDDGSLYTNDQIAKIFREYLRLIYQDCFCISEDTMGKILAFDWSDRIWK